MGLSKPIEMNNGIMLNYHRIVSIISVTNNQTTIEIGSYVSKEKRDEEAACMAALAAGDNQASCDVYIDTKYIALEYDPEMSVVSAYEYLKSEPMLQDEIENPWYGAEDVFEEEEDAA